MERWFGRVAVVTGASFGIGAAVSTQLVERGLKVVGVARKVENIQEIAKSLHKARGKLYALKADITKTAEVEAVFTWVRLNLGRIDILVNNAGADSCNSLTDGPFENWKLIFDLNVLALSQCNKEALRCMREKGIDDGHIININSVLGHTIPPSELPYFMYSSSKHTLPVLTEGLRCELIKLNSKIRVTSVSHGLVKTEFLYKTDSSNSTTEKVFLRKPHLKPEDVSDAILFVLATPAHVQILELTVKPVGEQF